jgi:uncharacterized membrane protein
MENMKVKERKGKDLESWAHSRIPELEGLKPLMSFLFEKRFAVVLGIAAIILLFFFWKQIEVFVIGAVFIALAAVSMIYNRWVKTSVGIELVTFGVVLMVLVYGRLPGLIVGLVGLFLAEVISEKFTYSTFVSFIGVGIMAMIAPNIFQLTGNSITATGIILTLVYDAIIIPGYLLLGSNIGRSVFFVITHLIFNTWLFAFAVPFVFRLLA